MFDLKGRTALVAGASRGIGLAIADGLQDAGANVVGLGRSDPTKVERSGNWEYVRCDITRPDEFAAACQTVKEKKGGLNIYVHAAGQSLALCDQSTQIQRFIDTIDVNLVSAYRCIAKAAECISPNAEGSVITISSIGALAGFPDNPGYVASKGGLSAMTRALAIDLGARNIRVNSIAPGYVHTQMTDTSFQNQEMNKARMKRMIIQRWGEPEDLVGATVFFASTGSAYITGQELVIDGGWMAKGLEK